MENELTIRVADPDPDYRGLEIAANNDRFAGLTRVLAELDGLSELADRIAGFPRNGQDEREFEFGSRDGAGGYCLLHFRCFDSAGHALVNITIEDEFPPERAVVSMAIQAAAVDRSSTNFAA